MQVMPEMVNFLVFHGLIVHYFEQSIQAFALVMQASLAYTDLSFSNNETSDDPS
jgi:hypothetical protein